MMALSWMSSTKDGEYEEKNRVSSYRGYCYKMRRSHNLLAPQWGKRWFSIEGRFLRWYRQESDISPSGMIDLRHVRNITKVDINGAFTFCVTCEDRNLIMRTNTLSEMNSWFRALHRHADLARGGDGTNVVSDFNEPPLRSRNVILSSSKSNKPRNRLTLEEEIDLNLQKLNELEIEVSTPAPDFIIEEKVGDKFEASSENLNDFHYSHQQSTNYSKPAKGPTPHYSNPMAEPPVVYRPQVAKKVPQPKTAPIFKPDFSRSESNESDNVSTSAPVNTSRITGTYRNGETPAAVAPMKKQSSHSRRMSRLRAEDEFSDEFDISMGSASPPQSTRVSRQNNAHANIPQSDRSFIRRFHDEEEGEEEDEQTSIRGRGGHASGRAGAAPAFSSGNHPLRNSHTRAAWN